MKASKSACVAVVLFAASSVLAQGPVVLGPYVYDGTGNITQIGTDRYVYDGMSRLTYGTANIAGNSNIQQFEYDGFGNLRKVTTNNFPMAIGVESASNHLLAVPPTAPPQGGVQWGGRYDDAGNQELINGGEYQYTFDSLSTATSLQSGAEKHFYLYDADDERIASVDFHDGANATWRYTLRNAHGQVVRLLLNNVSGGTSSWSWTRDYIYRDGQLLASVGPDGTTHYHLDHLGSPALITKGSGEQLALHKSWPFGVDAPGSTNDAELLKFTGHEFDDTPQDIYYMHARYYSAVAGRFLSVDPSKKWAPNQPQSWNRYSYALDNPLNRVDPSGEEWRGFLELVRQYVGDAYAHFRKADEAFKKVPVARLGPNVGLVKNGGQVGPVVLKGQLQLTPRVEASGKVTVAIRAQVQAGVADTPAIVQGRFSVGTTVFEDGHLASTITPTYNSSIVWGNDVKTSTGEVTYLFTLPGLSGEIGMNYREALNGISEVSLGLQEMTHLALPIKPHDRNEPDEP